MNPLLIAGGVLATIWALKHYGQPEVRPRRDTLKLKNPSPPLRIGGNRELAAARRLSQAFHGTPDQVIELEPQERRMPRYAVAVGDLEALTYAPRKGKRSGNLWEHKSGDRGMLKKESKGRALVAVDPLTRRPILVQHRSVMRLSPEQGLVG